MSKLDEFKKRAAVHGQSVTVHAFVSAPAGRLDAAVRDVEALTGLGYPFYAGISPTCPVTTLEQLLNL